MKVQATSSPSPVTRRRPFQEALTAEAPPADRVVLSRDKGTPAPGLANKLAPSQRRVTWNAALSSTPLFGVGGSLFPDSHGKIEHIALQLGNVEFDRPLPNETRQGLMGVWKQLFRSMNSETEFTLVCADSQGEKAVEELVMESGINPQRVHVVIADSQQGMSIWIRDSMLPTLGAEGQTKLLIQDRTYWPGPEDRKIPGILQAEHPKFLEAQPHPALRIDGGNVLSNSKQTIVGRDSIKHTQARLQELYQDPQRRGEIDEFYRRQSGNEPGPEMLDELPKLVFEAEFQRPVLVVAREREQPAFHIDMTLTPIGDHKFLVGDPSLAIESLRALTPAERDETNRSMALQAGLPSGEDLIEKLIQANSSAEKQADYDATARELAEEGYQIERIPALMGLRTTWSLPYLTYNNCMMENYQDKQGKTVKKVYLPQYNCPTLDLQAQEIYRSNGFEVVPLEMGAISKLEGAIRCSSYAVERDF